MSRICMGRSGWNIEGSSEKFEKLSLRLGAVVRSQGNGEAQLGQKMENYFSYVDQILYAKTHKLKSKPNTKHKPKCKANKGHF